MEQKFKVAVISNDVIENIIIAPLSFQVPDKSVVPLERLAQDESVEEILLTTPSGPPSIGWVWSGDTFENPVKEEDTLVESAAYLRWKAEVSGVEKDGVLYDTSRERRVELQALLQHIDLVGDSKIKANGKFTVVKVSDIKDELRIIFTHVQSCFDVEAEILEKIESGEITTLKQVAEYFSLMLSIEEEQQ